MSRLATKQTNISYDKELDSISNFLEKYTEFGSTVPKYQPILQRVANRQLDQIVVELDDILKHEQNENGLVRQITQNAKTYLELFSYIFDLLLPRPTVEINEEDDVVDVIMAQRRQKDLALNGNNEENQEIPAFPPLLTRRFTVVFKPLSTQKSLAVRELKAKYVGNLLTIRGIVTRVTDVKPLLVVNAYSCEECGSEIFQEVKSKAFTPLVECPSEGCKKNNTKGKLQMQTRASKFLKFQEAKIQEMADQVPVGHTPRYTTIHLYEGLTRTMNPGDVVDVSGIFLTTPFSGFKALRAGLLTDTFLQTQYVYQHKKNYSENEIDDTVKDQIEELKGNPDVYNILAKSIAPEIYGHEDVKKALLLLLVGGGTKTTNDGMKIRGDINICLMGDPGVAKSQLLKFISKIAPRGVYTTGRGSSGVGLTAAVMRDPVTDELVLEGGALVLADNGICCIDEFDKMDETDRTAIHEVMEQQTVSISKAGINTTLNARTSVLAAANPAFGRYNIHRSPTDNINLPAALLSRFDMLFLILDIPSREQDRLLADHVAYVHMHNKVSDNSNEDVVKPETLRHYVTQAKTIDSSISPNVVDHIISNYVSMRRKHAQGSTNGNDGVVTARSLLAIIRLSLALARVHFRETVEAKDVEEAIRLLEVTRALTKPSRFTQNDQEYSKLSKDDRIYRIIRNMWGELANEREKEDGLKLRDVRDKVTSNGFTEQELDHCIEKHRNHNVWRLNDTRTRLTLIV